MTPSNRTDRVKTGKFPFSLELGNDDRDERECTAFSLVFSWIEATPNSIRLAPESEWRSELNKRNGILAVKDRLIKQDPFSTIVAQRQHGPILATSNDRPFGSSVETRVLHLRFASRLFPV